MHFSAHAIGLLRDEHQHIGGRMGIEAAYLVNLAATGVGIVVLAVFCYIVWGDR